MQLIATYNETNHFSELNEHTNSILALLTHFAAKYEWTQPFGDFFFIQLLKKKRFSLRNERITMRISGRD